MDRARALTLVLWAFLLISAAGLAGRAAQTPFRPDEMLTLALAEVPPGPALWKAVAQGPDLSPPAAALAARTSEMWLGRGRIASRATSMLCGLVVLLAAFRIAARQGGADAAFASILAVSYSGLLWTFVEARPYALVLAGAMATWFCWQGLIAQPRFRRIKLAGISGGMKLAIVSHAVGLVLPLCFVVGILARAIRLKQIDWAALAAILVPLSLSVGYKPLFEAARRAEPAASASATSLLDAYLQTFGNLPGLTAIAAVVVGIAWWRWRPDPASPNPRPFYVEDYVVASTLVIAPVVIWSTTQMLGLPWSNGQALLAGLGLTFLFGQAMAGAARRTPWICRILLIVVAIVIAGMHLHTGVRAI